MQRKKAQVRKKRGLEEKMGGDEIEGGWSRRVVYRQMRYIL